MTRKPSVSIVVCTYNGEKYLREQLDSILAQTYPADEIIIQDDCSTDNTWTILNEYAGKFPNLIKILKNRGGVHGVNANFFSALERAKGDYIAISDQDDIWEQDKIELQMNTIGDNMLCTGFSIPFTTSGAAIRVDKRVPNCSLLRQLFVGTVPGHTILMTRELLNVYLALDNASRIRTYDAVLGIIATANNKLIFVDRPLVNHRRHIDAATYNTPTNNRMTFANILRNVFRTFKYYVELRPIIRERMQQNKRLLQSIDSKEQIHADAIKMCDLQISTGILSFFRLQWFCMKHCDQLFFAKTNKKTLLLRLRGAYFPISCSEYYRYLSKHFKK